MMRYKVNNKKTTTVAAALALLVIGGGLLLSWAQPSPPETEKPLPSTSRPVMARAVSVEDGSTLVEQGVLVRLWRGEIMGKEAYAVRQQGEGFVLTTTAEFQGSRQGVDFVQRLATSLPLAAEYRPQGYTLVQFIEWADDTLELMSAQIAFSNGQAQAEARWTQPEPFVQNRTWELPDLPVALLQPNVLSHWVVLTRLFEAFEVRAGMDELRISWLHPFADSVGTARIRRLEPVTIVHNGQEEMAERLEVTVELGAMKEVVELFVRNGEFLGAVAVGFGEDKAFIFRWDLFPEGFRVKR